MEFIKKIKSESILIPKQRKNKLAQFLGILDFATQANEEQILIQSKLLDIIIFCKNLIYAETQINLQEKTSNNRNQINFLLRSQNPSDNKKILELASKISKNTLMSESLNKDYIRGIFLICGNIKNPKDKYYIEFIVNNNLRAKKEEIVNYLQSNLANNGFNFKKKIVNQKTILYINNSSVIEDFLTYIGATKSSLELMNLKVYKNLRNKVNRLVNCETSNLNKIILASAPQIKAIKKIKESKGLSYLKPDLKEIAEKRLDNPELPLSELSEILSFKISKSGLYYKLKKIELISDEI